MKHFAGPRIFLFSLALGLAGCATPTQSFSTRIVDGLGRPVPGVTVDIHWLRPEANDDVSVVPLFKTSTDENGAANGTFDRASIGKGRDIWIEITKTGYQGFSTTGVRSNYVLERQFTKQDLDRLDAADATTRRRELHELLAGQVEGEELDKRIFIKESAYREELLHLVGDPKVSKAAIHLLSFIGVPEDLRLIVERAPSPKKKGFEDRWAYAVVCAITEPTSANEWRFLESAASGGFDDLWVDSGAISSLQLISSPESVEILKRARARNPERAEQIDAALAYMAGRPAPLEDQSLTALADRVAGIIKIGRWKKNEPPVFNEARDKAFVDFRFRSGRDLLIHTATFHKVGDVWKFRGVRETMQALLSGDAEDEKE